MKSDTVIHKQIRFSGRYTTSFGPNSVEELTEIDREIGHGQTNIDHLN